MTEIKTIRATCGSCKQTTNHKIQARYDHTQSVEYDENQFFDQTDNYMVLQCAGCDTISFIHLVPIDGEAPFPIQYPDPDRYVYEALFLPDEDHDQLPTMIHDLYAEVRAAFEDEASVLAGIGLRTLVEAVCIHQKIPGSNLFEKIKKLHAKGLISASELPILDKLRLIGNVSAHQIKSIPIAKLEAAVHVINHVLRSVYILPKLDKKIKL